MKKTLLITSFFFAYIYSIQAQNLYGTSFNGGRDGGGTINNFMPAANNLIVPNFFESLAANPGYTSFIQAGNGKLYGMTTYGGSKGYGVIFSFDRSSSTYTKLKDFDNTGGSYPYGSLMQAKDGKLYGMTLLGGSRGFGVIFSFDPSSYKYKKLMDFDSTNGANPNSTLIQASDGKLYGTTVNGGSINAGVIFSFDPSFSKYTKLMDFDMINGSHPPGSLVQSGDGKLYGMTNHGGNNNFGVIFSFEPSSSTYVNLLNFDHANGEYPDGNNNLMLAGNGKLYGMTAYGGSGDVGVIFSFDPSSSTYTKLKDFDNANEGYPFGSLMQATNGKLYGMTSAGGSAGAGLIFSFDPASSTYKKVKDFDLTNGGYPDGSLMQASDGKLYGMTYGGGSTGAGMIFSFDPASSGYKSLKDFGTNKNGTNASASLVQTGDGKIYGMTNAGGSKGAGVFFTFDPSLYTYTKLKDFDYVNGANPYGSLLKTSDGKLYGMTTNGGTDFNGHFGVIFSFDPSSATYTKLWDFDNELGAHPVGSLIRAGNGKLYGMTGEGGGRLGGGDGYGVIFSFDLSSSTYTMLKSFDIDDADGAVPYGSLIQATNGKLYGMTSKGGSSGHGVIFSYNPVTAAYKKLLDFDNINGSNPYGSVIQASNGKLYGMTAHGGSNDNGVIFSYDPSSSVYTMLQDFDNTDGANPLGNFFQAGNGKLYGITNAGGSENVGVIFSFDPSSCIYTKLKDYNNSNGANPYIGSALIDVSESGPLPVTLLNFTGKSNGNNNQLSWQVENEQNLNYYELQGSNDGQNFQRISQIKATGNNRYTYNDPVTVAVSSIYYYRLKSVDKDGQFVYSLVIKIRVSISGFAVIVPNPFYNKLVVNIESFIKDKATFVLTDLGGRQLVKANKQVSPGTNVIEINETAGLPAGTYILTIISSQSIQSIKVVKGN